MFCAIFHGPMVIAHPSASEKLRNGHLPYPQVRREFSISTRLPRRAEHETQGNASSSRSSTDDIIDVNMQKNKTTSISISFICIAFLMGCGGESDPEISSVNFSPDSKFIVFAYTKGKTSHLFSAALTDGSASRLTKSDCTAESDPAFSPSGDALAFSCAGHLYLIKTSDHEAHQIVPSDGHDVLPKFSPDGRKIYFGRYGYYGNYSPIAQPGAHEWNIFVVNLADGKVQRLTNENFYGIGEISISPEGKEMIVSTADKGILVYSTTKGVNLRKFNPAVKSAYTTQAGNLIDDVQYAGDGNSVFFMSACDGTDGFDYDVYKTDLKTGLTEQLTTRNGYSTGLRISPDGKSAIFLKWSKNWHSTPIRPILYLLNLQTRDLRKLNISFKR